MNIKINCHSSIKIESEKTIWIDPFKIKEKENNADIIFITHNHYDHYSREDIEKVIKQVKVKKPKMKVKKKQKLKKKR